MMILAQSMLVLSIVMVCLLISGLFKPWALLWWRATQTRLDVIRLYGTAAAVSYFVYWMLKLNT